MTDLYDRITATLQAARTLDGSAGPNEDKEARSLFGQAVLLYFANNTRPFTPLMPMYEAMRLMDDMATTAEQLSDAWENPAPSVVGEGE